MASVEGLLAIPKTDSLNLFVPRKQQSVARSSLLTIQRLRICVPEKYSYRPIVHAKDTKALKSVNWTLLRK